MEPGCRLHMGGRCFGKTHLKHSGRLPVRLRLRPPNAFNQAFSPLPYIQAAPVSSGSLRGILRDHPCRKARQGRSAAHRYAPGVSPPGGSVRLRLAAPGALSQPSYCSSQTDCRKDGPPGGNTRRHSKSRKMEKKPTPYQREMLKNRGLNWRDWMLVKETFTSLYFKNVRTGQVKLIGRGERIR